MKKQILRNELLADSTFWAAHMWNISRGPLAKGEADSLDMAFGLSTDKIEKFYRNELSNEDEWPLFSIQCCHGYTIEIEYSNEPEDYQLTYRICKNHFDKSVCVGKSGGHWQLPALRWSELIAICRTARIASVQENAFACTLLLLLPSVWITVDDKLDEIRFQLIKAWQCVISIEFEQAKVISDLIVEFSHSEVRWSRDENLGWINDSIASVRNPNALGCLNSCEQAFLAVFLSECERV